MGQHHYPARTLNNCNEQEKGEIKKRGRSRKRGDWRGRALQGTPPIHLRADIVLILSRHGAHAKPAEVRTRKQWPGLPRESNQQMFPPRHHCSVQHKQKQGISSDCMQGSREGVNNKQLPDGAVVWTHKNASFSLDSFSGSSSVSWLFPE